MKSANIPVIFFNIYKYFFTCNLINSVLLLRIVAISKDFKLSKFSENITWLLFDFGRHVSNEFKSLLYIEINGFSSAQAICTKDVSGVMSKSTASTNAATSSTELVGYESDTNEDFSSVMNLETNLRSFGL